MPLYLNPGLTFGTGSHATTQLCLELLEEAVRPGCQVLDLGCGSGILAIAALGLGAAHAIGVDIDPKAVDVAYENAAMNGIGPDRLTVYAGNVLGDAKLAAKLRPGQKPGGAGQHRGGCHHPPVRRGGAVHGSGWGVPGLRYYRRPGG